MEKGISYNNKDILFKVLSQNYQNKSLEVYGLDVPKIKRLLPSDFPTVAANETHADNIFMLEDSSLLILEYESTTSLNDFLKYNQYMTRILERLLKQDKKMYNITIAVIYTGDIEESPATLELGSLSIHLKQVFLSKFNTSEIYTDIKNKINSGEPLSDNEVMQLIILPLTQPNKKQKQELIENTISLAKQVTDENQQLFIIAGILTATDKFIDKEYSNQIKEWIKMTKIARLYEEEKVEAVNQSKKNTKKDIAMKMLINKKDFIEIMEFTELTKEELEELQEELNDTSN